MPFFLTVLQSLHSTAEKMVKQTNNNNYYYRQHKTHMKKKHMRIMNDKKQNSFIHLFITLLHDEFYFSLASLFPLVCVYVWNRSRARRHEVPWVFRLFRSTAARSTSLKILFRRVFEMPYSLFVSLAESRCCRTIYTGFCFLRNVDKGFYFPIAAAVISSQPPFACHDIL